MPKPRLVHAILLLTLLFPLGAGAFTFSSAPVVNDPTLTRRPSAQKWPHISLAEARRLLGRDGFIFVDARARSEYKQSHLPGSVSLPAGDFENTFPLLRHRLIHAKALICYCHGYSCGIGDYICGLLADQGLRNMCVFSGGFPAWKDAGYPLEAGNAAQPRKHALETAH